jgi:cytochrome c nitrite reductase small subunit
MSQIRLLLVAGLLLGAALGIGSFTFVYANGASYLSDNPATCANCHVMGDHYAAWVKSSHREFATCNDCHTPRDGLLAKYANKAANGFLHSMAFTTGNYPDPMRIRGFNAAVTEASCRSCHVITESMAGTAHSEIPGQGRGQDLSCVQCHGSVGHWVR